MISFPSERPAARLYIAEPLAAGALVPLPDEAVHRLRNVLRLAPGATVAAFNERDGEFRCRIETLRRSHGTLQAIEQRRAPEPGPDVWLVFAPIKRARLDWLVEKATELGAAALVPVVTARTQPERLNRERLRVIAVAAAEQSERLSLPEIRPEVPLARAARRVARRPAPRPVRRERRRPADRRGARRVRRRPAPAGACLSARKAASPKRSLTLSANSPLLPGSGSARGCCAPRPPLLPRWRFFRRSPETGGSPGRADSRPDRSGALIVAYHRREFREPHVWAV